MKDLTRGFLEEARELNQTIYQTIKTARERIDEGREPVQETQEIFRSFHTLKGLAGMNDFSRLARFAHTVEDTLDAVRKGQIPFSGDLTGQLVLCTEIIDRYLESIATIGEDSIDRDMQSDVMNRLIKLTGDGSSVRRPKVDILPDSVAEQLNDMELARLHASLSAGSAIYLVRTTYDFDTFDRDMKHGQEEINKRGEWLATLPGEEPADEQSISFAILLAWPDGPENLKAVFPTSARVRTLHAGTQAPDDTEPPPGPSTPQQTGTSQPVAASAGESVRVPLSELDALVRQLEDLMLIRNQLKRDVNQLLESGHADLQADQVHFRLDRIGEQIAGLQKRIVQFRMVPLETLFRPLETSVLRTAESLDRKVKVRFSGGNVRIDKRVTDRLQDPLIHLLRNAVDHGIEPPDVRKKAGKDPVGQIELTAVQQGNAVHIEIRDDGAGLNLTRIGKQAEKRGLIPNLKSLADTEIMGLIFQPGFSTAEDVSEVSGRGVGLDAVKEDVNRLGGSIQVRSKPGAGTAFILQIPITRAILPVCFVRSGDTVLAVPLLFVADVQPYAEDETDYVRDRLFYRLHDTSLPAIRLPLLLNTADLTTETRIVLRIAHVEQPFCLIVEDILGQREIAMTPFSGKPARIPLFTGICNYSADSLGYVLDIPELAKHLGGSHE